MSSPQDLEPNKAPENKSRKQFTLMLTIMFVTLGGSYLLFLVVQNTGVWGTVNKGQFVTPSVSVTDFDWRTVESAPFRNEFPAAFAEREAAGSVKRTWWLLAVANEGCERDCNDALSHMRALQILLTKDATRVRRALVLPDATSEAIAEQYPKLIQLSGDESAQSSETYPATGVYIVDPTGVLVLRYPLLDSAVDIQKDLKRLLKYSQLG